jgi:hypothetical protein
MKVLSSLLLLWELMDISKEFGWNCHFALPEPYDSLPSIKGLNYSQKWRKDIPVMRKWRGD